MADARPGTIVFDLDGVLVDSEPYWRRGFSYGVAESLGRRGHGTFDLRPEDMVRFVGGRVPDTVRAVIGSLDLDLPEREIDEIVDEVITFVSEEFHAAPTPIEPAVATVRGLHAAGVTLGLASSSALPFIEAALDILGIAEMFDARASAIGLAVGKPDPEVYRLVLDELGSDPEHTLAIEDSRVGVAAALNAGMHCIWVGWGETPDPGDPTLAEQVIGEVDTDHLTPVDDLTTDHVLEVLRAVNAGDSRV